MTSEIEPNIYVTFPPKNDEQPTESIYESLPYNIPWNPPPPPPYQAQVHTGQLGTSSELPARSLSCHCSRCKWAICIIFSTALVLPVTVMLPILLSSANPSSGTTSSTCQIQCAYSSKCIYANQKCNGITDCPAGDDEVNCVTKTPGSLTCPMYCSYTTMCVYAYQICDGVRNCPYGDDEMNCASKTTTPSTPVCPMYCSFTYMCIYAYQICNGVRDCHFGDDERNCATTTPSTPTCPMYCSYTHTCIHAYQICNGIKDCFFGDDERNCATTTPSTLTCPMYCSYTHTCIHAYQICNGIKECLLGDDERNCVKTPSLPVYCEKRCGSSVSCVRSSQWCDGVSQCPNGEDEMSCVRLYGADSQLQVYSTLKSAWLPVCADNWTDAYGRFACQDFGYSGSSYNRSNMLMSPFSPVGYFKLNNGNWTSRFYTSVENSFSCFSGYVVSIECISCGVSYNNVTGQTVGGTNATLGDWPWQVYVQHITGILCGGSIISPKWIVTAAHCVYGYSSAPGWKVFAGTLTLPRYYDPSGYSVERIITHPGYYSVTYNNDIALMKLSNGITFGYNTQPVCLPNAGMFWTAGTLCWISGWGTTYHGAFISGTVSTSLNYAAVPLIDSNVCKYHDMYNEEITPSMICAGYLSGGVGSCQGDSGGPLVTKTNGTWWLVGDTSWGYGCARANKPGVYGNMTMFSGWIYLQMRTDD
uniref:Transmembrane serine protease 2 gene 6 n=1 Tax=Xenopus tropicalis TaxID=8364 RepID=A0A803JQH3_XENTR